MDPPAEEDAVEPKGGPGKIARVRATTGGSLGALVALWLGLGLVLFLVVALVTQSFVAALLAGLVGGLAAAVALGRRLGFLQRVDEARRQAPLWARLLIPIPLLVFLFVLLLVALGPLVPQFVVLVLADGLLSVLLTAAAVKFLGLWRDVPDKVRATPRAGRLFSLVAIGLAVGLLAFLLVLMLLEEAYPALAIFLPATIAGVLLAALVTRWGPDAKAGVRDLPLPARLAQFVILLLFVTYYFALLIGRYIPNATLAYTASVALALVVLVPLSLWARLWQDAWARFKTLGQSHRLYVVLPVFPIAIVLVFALVVVLTSMFELAYLLSVPCGLVAFLLVGRAFHVTQEIPGVVRRQNLPRRVLILAALFLFFVIYAYFGIALVTQRVEVSLLAAILFAAAVVAVVLRAFHLDRGLKDEFKTYGARGETLVMGLVFLCAFALVFIVLALTTRDFRIAFLVSVVAAVAITTVFARTSGMIEGARTAVGRLNWWAALLILAAIFVIAMAYGALAVGLFVPQITVALAVGALIGLLVILLAQRTLRLGADMVATADERRSARSVLLVLTFLGGFLVGLYASAAALSAAGSDLFGFPFFIGLLCGAGALVTVSRLRGWESQTLVRVRGARDRVKLAFVVALWLALGVLTGFALQSVPIGGANFGFGDENLLPLTITLAIGLLLWTPLPVVMFRTVGVERTPVRATLAMGEKPRFLASLGWGLLTFVVLVVVLLSVISKYPLVAFGAAFLASYVVALMVTTKGARRAPKEPI